MKVSIVMYIISIAILGGFGYRIYLIVRALKKYISLGEALKEHCTAFKMTQEFVTESLGGEQTGSLKMGSRNLRS